MGALLMVFLWTQALRVKQYGKFSRRMWGTSAHGYQDLIMYPVTKLSTSRHRSLSDRAKLNYY
jgi:hypothetical protein